MTSSHTSSFGGFAYAVMLQPRNWMRVVCRRCGGPLPRRPSVHCVRIRDLLMPDYRTTIEVRQAREQANYGMSRILDRALVTCNTDPRCHTYARERKCAPGVDVFPPGGSMRPVRGDGYLGTVQLAQMLGVAPATVRSWRYRGWIEPQGLDEYRRPPGT